MDENYNNVDLWNKYLIIPSTYDPKEEEDCDGFGCDEIIETIKETKELELKFREWQKQHPHIQSKGLGKEAEQYYLFKKSIEEAHMWDID